MKHAPAYDFLAGGGEMGALMRAKDWSGTPLGAPAGWPQSLRTAVSILLNSRYPMFIFWGPQHIKIYNDGYRPITGDKHPWALGRPGTEVWPEIWDAIGPMVERVVRHGEATWSDDLQLFMHRRGFPEEVFFTFSYSPIREESGGVGGMFCACTETTVKVQGERRLKLLRDLAAAPAHARSVAEACALSAEVLAGCPADIPFALVYLQSDDGTTRLGASAGVRPGDEPGEWPLAERRQVRDLVSRFRHVPAGPWPEAPSAAMVLPLVDRGQDRPSGALVLGISSRIAFDDAYRGFFELVAGQLATSIANAKAAEEERRRAEALAELDRAKTAFFSNVSHEFRTPLTLMLGPVEDSLADADAPLPPAQRERIELAHRSALRLQKLVNTLLDFSRIEAGRAQARYVPTDLAVLTADLASSFRSALEKAGLGLAVDCPPLGEPVYVDREMWEKIVLNLLSNAFKFTFAGEVAVTLRRQGAGCELSVRDTGTGIAAAELPRLFERFRRVEGARSRTHEGTGIGLALVQELARLHGGRVEVRSTLGEGSTFTVFIPFGRAHLPAERIEASPALASTALGVEPFLEEALRWLPDAERAAAPSDGPRSRVLWADDNADMRDYVRRLLAQRYDVQAVADGAEALAAARASPPDLVLADVMMPGLDGLALARALRADPRTRGIPVILLSARAGEEARIEGLDAGADDYLCKPFSARELLARISARLELSRLQERLHEERDATASLFSQTPVPVAVLRGPDLVFEMANPAYLAVVGGRELLGKPMLEALPEARGQGFEELLREVMRTGKAHVGHEVPVRLERRGAVEEAFFTFIYAPLSRAGATDAVIAICNEVTEQVRARQRIAESEARYRQLVSLLPVAVYTCAAPSGAINFYNEQAAALWGRAPAPGDTDERFCGALRLWRPDGSPLPHGETPMALALAEGRPFRNQDVVIERPDGSRVTVLVNIDPIRDAEGRVVGAINVFHNVTAQRRAEETIAQSEERFRTLVSVITDVPWTADAEGRFAAAQPAWAAYTGQSADESQGFGWAEALHPDDRDRVLARWTEACRMRAVYETEARLWHAPSGAYRHVVERAAPLADAAGEVREWVGAATDVHERVLAEQALRENDRRKDEFLAMLSHELRNPLAPISNAVALLKDAQVAPPLREQACAILERQVSHLIRLVEDLLDIARISRGSISLQKEVVALGPILEAALETSAPLIEAAGHRLEVRGSDEPVSLLADRVRLAQVVSNLLNNSARYTPRGGRIELAVQAEPGAVTIVVRDNGVGISAEVLPRIFDMFTQDERTRRDAPGGLGIGLALARQLVELHGGSIVARSAGPGGGAEFAVRLPVLAGSRPLLVAAPRGQARAERCRILVVDDNVDAAESLGMVLESMGHAVQLAYDGAAALEAARRDPPELILADLDLPGLDGFALAARLREDPRLAAVPLIAVSGFGQEADRRRAREAGFDEHLIKPVEAALLAAKLELVRGKAESA